MTLSIEENDANVIQVTPIELKVTGSIAMFVLCCSYFVAKVSDGRSALL